jgi:hypothetical protein
MGSSERKLGGSWAPDACTLQSAEQPLRVAEFDQFFAEAVRTVDRLSPTLLRMDLAPSAEIAAQAASLAARETACCGFFTFTLVASAGTLLLDVSTPAGYVDVLDALTVRAAAGVQS